MCASAARHRAARGRALPPASPPADRNHAGDAPALLRRGPGAVERLAGLYSGPVLADDAAIVAGLRPVLGERIALARGPTRDEALEAEVAALSEPVVPLPGGGRMSIHPTPALTAIDIDAAEASAERASKTASQTALNTAAVPEITRQIRLRNLSGAILIDWAGLSPKRRAALGPGLHAALAADRLRPRLLGFTALGMAEIVRTRIHPPLHELLSGPHAAGLAGLRQLVADSAADPSRPRALRAAPAVAAALAADAAARADIARLTGRSLILRADPALRPGNWLVETLGE